jgi:hypothetical protein
MLKHPALSAALAIAVLAFSFVLNPSPAYHRTKIKETIGERNPIAGALGVGSLTALASTYHSLGVASYVTAGERTLSVGMFGLVFVLQ